MKIKRSRLAFIIFISVLLAVSLFFVLYIRGLLVKFEASQPEREVEKQIELLKKAAEEGTVTSLLSFDAYKPESSEQFDRELAGYTDTIKSGNLTYEARNDGFSTGGYVYDIKSGSETLARLTLESASVKTKLIVFNFETWRVASFEPAVLDKSFDLPSALKLKINGGDITGVPSETAGMITYKVCSLTTPEITIEDVSGGTVKYDPGKPAKTYSYTVSIPSNFVLYANGTAVSPEVAESKSISAYESVSEYVQDMPTQLTYSLYFLTNSIDFKITDNLGGDVPFEMVDRKITIEEQTSIAAVPDSIKSEIDILDAAQQWSLFMTNDLTGANRGYATIKKLLIPGSALQTVAWKWATGIDITFTSIHRLGNPPFIEEEVTDYVSYGDNAFSCTVRFKKHMILNTGMDVKDPMNSTFYFVKYDDTKDNRDNPRWLIADIRENVNKGGN